MPTIRNRRVLAGVGGGFANISIDGVVPQGLQGMFGGSAESLDADRLVFTGTTDNSDEQSWRLYEYSRSDDTVRPARLTNGQDVTADFDPNLVKANGGAWAGSVSRKGILYRDSEGRTSATWGVWAVTVDGDILIHTNPNGQGDLKRLRRDGTADVLDANVPNPSSLSSANGLIVATYRGAVQAYGTPLQPRVAGTLFSASVAVSGAGEPWLLADYGWANQRGLVLQPWSDPTQAIVIARDGQEPYYRPDCEFQPDGTLWVVTAEDLRESPDRLRCWQFDLTANRRRLVRVTPTLTTAPVVLQDWTPFTRVDLTQPPLPTIQIPNVNRAWLCGPYHATSGDPSADVLVPGGQVDTLGNVEVPVRARPEQLAAIERQVITDAVTARTVASDRVWGVYVHLQSIDVADLEDAAKEAARRQRPRVIYWDGPDIPEALLSRLGPSDVLSPQWYPIPGETVDVFRQRIAASLVRLEPWGHRLLPTIACYDLGFLTSAQLLRVLEACVTVAVGSDRVIGLLWFAWLRANGIWGHPELIPYLQTLMAGITGSPEPLPLPPIPIPPGPIPPPVPPPEEIPMLEGQARETMLSFVGKRAAKFWAISDTEGVQGVREVNDQFRAQHQIDGDPFALIVGAGLRAKGDDAPTREELVKYWGLLRR